MTWQPYFSDLAFRDHAVNKQSCVYRDSHPGIIWENPQLPADGGTTDPYMGTPHRKGRRRKGRTRIRENLHKKMFKVYY